MLVGVEHGGESDASQRTAFRTSWTQPEGVVGAIIIEGKVADVNTTLWTVDVVSQFDQKWYLNVQVSSPYMHSKRGEGIYAVPDLGAKCHVCIPSDGPPPFILDFIMPHEGTSDEDAPEDEEADSDPSFGGGRSTKAKPGDIYMKGRDGQFVTLHRGGVLQIGSTELAQRIYIPLQNLITDISQNYKHYNTGGSETWFLASGESETNPPTIRRDTYRLLAGDAKATIRVTRGQAKDIVNAAGGDEISSENQLGVGSATAEDNPVIYEVAIAPEGFEPSTGSPVDPKVTVLRYQVDKAGGVSWAASGNVALHIAKKLRLVVQDNIDIVTKKSFSLTVSETARIDGGKLLELNGGVIKMNGGSNQVAYNGVPVEVTIGIPLVGVIAPGPTPAVPGSFITILPINPLTGQPQTIKGTIISGNPRVLI